MKLCPKLWTQRLIHGKSTVLSTKLVDELVDHICDGRRVMAVYYTSVDRNVLTAIFRFVTNLLYNLFLRLCRG